MLGRTISYYNGVLASSLMLLMTACGPTQDNVQSVSGTYLEPYRPQYHFTPDHNWTNDPNGLVYYNGEYHIFYQYNPYANKWGHMSWGHAVSKDLAHWTHLPVAIEEYIDKSSGDSTMIFSGSAVADTANTSGFFPDGKGGIVAIYTSHVHRDGQQLTQHQSIAYSKDDGRTFTRYDGNPVLDIRKKDFRDPKVIWHEPTKSWIMAAVIPDEFKVHFYGSPNLKDWTFLSEFGPLGDTAKIWECPDLIEVAYVDAPEKKKWVLIVSNSHPQGPEFVGMQYFIGAFDGKTFTPETPAQYPQYLEYGKDYYAGVTFNNIMREDGRVMLVGWVNNWAYGGDLPTVPWKGAMAIPRELYITNITGEGTRLIQQPMRELTTLRGAEITDLTANKNKSVEIIYMADFGDFPAKGKTGIKVLKGGAEETLIYYDAESQYVYIDRTKSGKTDFHDKFSSIDGAPVMLRNDALSLRVLIDQSIIEVYINDGTRVMTSQVFPTSAGAAIETFAGDSTAVTSIQVWEMKSIWR